MVKLGVKRKVDEVGRITIPIEIRELFNIHYGDIMEWFTDNGMVLLKKVKEDEESESANR